MWQPEPGQGGAVVGADFVPQPLHIHVFILQRQGVGQNWYGLQNKNVTMHDSYSKAFETVQMCMKIIRSNISLSNTWQCIDAYSCTEKLIMQL